VFLRLLPHPRRNLGFVALGATGMLAALGWAAGATVSGGALPRVPCLLLGFTGALVNVPLRSAYLAAVPADARGNGMAVMNTAIYVLTTLLALLMLASARTGALARPFAQLAFLAALTAAGAALAWRVLLAPTLELIAEIVLLPVYRIRAYGPGRERIPTTGPVLVVANHAAYLDPLWLGKILPRQITPMMTSVFYDKPVIHWLMVHAVGAIRVPDATFRREVPELQVAADVLRRDGCLLIFPEGGLRRRDDQPLRHFGQGVWHILRERPETPVVVCWIEGGWGSFMSYRNGLPMTNKRLDWWRTIRIGVAEPQVLDPAILADQRRTRAYLQRACLECRRYLGLDVPAPTEPLPEKDEGQRVEDRR
jgi:1-acyl-sn-glycerol-3-phosphate acyltransferase